MVSRENSVKNDMAEGAVFKVTHNSAIIERLAETEVK
jgi:hypothetical protein